ncbi:hypothetical protein J008_03885, partial [Cryptococcus neoformans]
MFNMRPCRILLLILPAAKIVADNVEKSSGTNYYYLSSIDPAFGFGHGVNNAVERATATTLQSTTAHRSSQWERRQRSALANAPQSQTNDNSGQWISKSHYLGERQLSTFARVNVLAAVKDGRMMQGFPSVTTNSTAVVISTMYVTVYRSAWPDKTSVPSLFLPSHGITAIAIDPGSSESTSISADLASTTATPKSIIYEGITKTLPTVIGPSSTMSSSHEDEDNVQAWIKAHNNARIMYGAGQVTWDDGLAEMAEVHASLCNKEHTKAAENLRWGSGFGTPQDDVNEWMSEAALYDWDNPGYSGKNHHPMGKGCVESYGKILDAIGHFTQVVWKNTTRIGCYIARCPKGSVVFSKYDQSYQTACEYDPPMRESGLLAEKGGTDDSAFNSSQGN